MAIRCKGGAAALAIAVMACIVILPSLALAEDGACGGVLDGVQEIASARIAATEARTYFVLSRTDKTPSCPSTAPQCRAKAFLVPGDEVLVGAVAGSFRCATFRAPGGAETDGYLPEAALSLLPPAEVKPSDFVGSWRRDREASLKLELADGGQAISIDGEATFGALDPDRVKRGNVHVGELSDKSPVKGNMLVVGEGYDGSEAPHLTADYDCRVRLRLFGRYLVVEDNSTCGGAGVTFTGIYTRAK
jgi:hypothetical protein